jgi:hypothetical protein
MARIISPKNNLFGGRGSRKPNRFFLDPSHPLNQGLVSYWPWGDSNTSTAGGGGPLRGGLQDVATTQNYGSVGGTLTTAGSHHGGVCAGFDGSTSFIQAGSVTQYALENAGTWSIWIKTSSLNGGWPLIWEQWQVVPVKNGAGLFLESGTGKIFFQAKNSGGTSVVSLNAGSSLADGVWHHIVATFSQGTCAVYIDGALLTSATASGAWAFNSNQPQWGKSGDSFFVKFLGSMGDARIYNRILSASEIRQLYVAPYAGIYELPANIGRGASVASLTGTGTLAFGGFSFSGSGSRKETGTGTLAFRGFSFSSSGAVSHTATGVLAWRGVAIVANAMNLGSPGSGLRQFWTF